LLVIDSGIGRELVGSAYNARRDECADAARRLGVTSLRQIESLDALAGLPSPDLQRARHVVTENQRVLRALDAEAWEFGQLMNESHASLRDDYEVSVPGVDALVAFLQAQPAVWGARMTGAGFGGACVALARAGRVEEVIEHLRLSGRFRSARPVVPLA
jgi:galactokinase